MADYQLPYSGDQIKAAIAAALNPDTQVTPGSQALVTSGAVDAATSQYQQEIESKADASDLDALEANVTALEAVVSDKADKNGNYENMTVGSAEQLLSTVNIEDKVPYVLRSSGGSADIGDREEDMLVGGTVAWNQRVSVLRASATVNGLTITNNFPEITVVGTCTSTDNYSITGAISSAENHVCIAFIGTNRTSGYGLIISGTQPPVGSDGVIYKKGEAVVSMALSVNNGVSVNLSLKPTAFDLTQMFGATIADYIYSLEQATAGAGVALFRNLFPDDYYPYNVGELLSVNAQAHVMRDANSQIIGNYPLDADLILRGIPKLDANNNLYYDGDTYESNGTVTRRYGIVNLGTLNWNNNTGTQYYASYPISGKLDTINAVISSGKYEIGQGGYNNVDKGFTVKETALWICDSDYQTSNELTQSLANVYLVYELKTATTETADPFTNPQIVEPDGTEEYVVTEQRGVSVPVGHVTQYPENLRDKLQHLPDLASADGKYVVQQTGNQMALAPFTVDNVPTANSANPVKSGGVFSAEEASKQMILASFPTDTITDAAVASFPDGADDIPIKSMTVNIDPVQPGSGDPSPTNVRPISGWTGANIVVSPTLDATDGTTYPVSWQTEAGTVYGGTLRDNGDGTWTLTVRWAGVDLAALTWTPDAEHGTFSSSNLRTGSAYKYIQQINASMSASVVARVEKYNPISLNEMTASYPDNSFAITTIGNITVKADASPSGFLAYQIKNGQPLPEYTLTAGSVKTLLGDNNIWADTGDVLELVYRVDPQAVAVQSDWNENDTDSLAFIKNKPTIPAAQVNADWDAVSGVAQILNKPTIPAAQVNADWNASSGVAEILNKPTIPSTHETWTFTLTDGTTVTKEVVLWQ